MGEDKYVENWALCKDGSEKLIAWKNSYILDEAGKTVGSIGSGDDITDRSRNEERILLLKKFAEETNEAGTLNSVLRGTLKTICDFTNWPLGHAYIPDTNDPLRVISSNIWYSDRSATFKKLKKATKKTHFSFGVGTPGISWKEQTPLWANEFKVKGGFFREKEARYYGLTGVYSLPIILEDKVSVILEFFYKGDKDENTHLLDELIVEIQDQLESLVNRERFQEELKEAKRHAEDANKAKSVFLANMSHEIRTPMNAILGHAQILNRNKNSTEEQRQSIITINKSGQHLLNLINEVLNMSKIEMGKMTLDYSTFNLEVLLIELREMLQFDLNPKGLRLTNEYSDLVPELIKTDQNKVRQIIINLLANAIKFTEKGNILIKTSLAENQIIIDVIDKGIGISKEKITEIFEPFVQAEEGIIKGGTGLGLSISRKMALLIGGNISVTSKLGKGSKFTFNFPYQTGDQDTLIRKNSIKQIIGIKSKKEIPKILIVDDLLENRQVLEIFLKSIGFEIKSVTNGKEGVEAFEEWNPDVILMDMVMPVMNGIDAIRLIRAKVHGKKVRIIAISANAFDKGREEILKLGANAFVRKPYNESELLQEIKNCISIKYIYQELPEERPKKPMNKGIIRKMDKKLRNAFIQAIKEGDIEQVNKLSTSTLKESGLQAHIKECTTSMDLETLEELFY